MRTQEIYLDKRFLVNGKKSHIHLDNFIKFSDAFLQIYGLLPPSLFAVYTFQNGLTLDPVTLTVSWGGTLINDTVITGPYSTTFEVSDYFTTSTNNITFNAANDYLVNAGSGAYTTANVISNTAVQDITNTAGTIYTENAVDIINNGSATITNNTIEYVENATTIDNNALTLITNDAPTIINTADGIENNATDHIYNTTVSYTTVATTITETATEIINSAEYIQNETLYTILNNTGTDLINAVGGNLNSIVTGNITNTSENVYNTINTSIINTTPYIFNDVDIEATNATTSITNTTPLLSNVISSVYQTNNSVFQASCGANAFYKSGEQLFTNVDFINGGNTYFDGQFSAIESQNFGITRTSGFYTFLGDCNLKSLIRSTDTAGLGQYSSIEIESDRLFLSTEIKTSSQSAINMTSAGMQLLVTDVAGGTNTAINVSPTTVQLAGVYGITTWSYDMPNTSPNNGDILVSNSSTALEFKSPTFHVESRETVIAPNVTSYFTFLIPDDPSVLKTINNLTFYMTGDDAASLDVQLVDYVANVVLTTATISTPPGAPGFHYVGSATFSTPVSLYNPRYLRLVVTGGVDFGNITEMSIILNIKHTY